MRQDSSFAWHEIGELMNLTTEGLERFVEAQNRVYETVCDELAMGEKTTHWMWFIFPQFRDLGRSPIRVTLLFSQRTKPWITGSIRSWARACESALSWL